MNNKTYIVFDNAFYLISEILLSWIKRLSPFMTAILPGFFFGYTIYEFVYLLTNNHFVSGFIGFSAFVVLESAGIWSGHKIAEYAGSDTFDWKIGIPITTLILYTTIGIGTLWFLDSIDYSVQIVGTSVLLLACVIYILFGLQSYQEKMERRVLNEKRRLELENKIEQEKNDTKESNNEKDERERQEDRERYERERQDKADEFKR